MAGRIRILRVSANPAGSLYCRFSSVTRRLKSQINAGHSVARSDRGNAYHARSSKPNDYSFSMHLISAFSALFTALMVFATPSWAQIQRSESSLPQPANLLADKTLADWRDVWDRAHRSTKAEHFEVQDGVLRIKGGTNGAIVTSKKYETFELRFQWRWPDAPGNGGVMFHTEPSRGALFVTGIEVQLRDGEAGDIYGVGINALSRDRKRQQGNRIMRMPLDESQTPIEKKRWCIATAIRPASVSMVAWLMKLCVSVEHLVASRFRPRMRTSSCAT